MSPKDPISDLTPHRLREVYQRVAARTEGSHYLDRLHELQKELSLEFPAKESGFAISRARTENRVSISIESSGPRPGESVYQQFVTLADAWVFLPPGILHRDDNPLGYAALLNTSQFPGGESSWKECLVASVRRPAELMPTGGHTYTVRRRMELDLGDITFATESRAQDSPAGGVPFRYNLSPDGASVPSVVNETSDSSLNVTVRKGSINALFKAGNAARAQGLSDALAQTPSGLSPEVMQSEGIDLAWQWLQDYLQLADKPAATKIQRAVPANPPVAHPSLPTSREREVVTAVTGGNYREFAARVLESPQAAKDQLAQYQSAGGAILGAATGQTLPHSGHTADRLRRWIGDLSTELPGEQLWPAHAMADDRGVRVHRAYFQWNDKGALRPGLLCRSCGELPLRNLAAMMSLDGSRISLLVLPGGEGSMEPSLAARLLEPTPVRTPFEIAAVVAPSILRNVEGAEGLYTVEQRLRWVG